MMAWNAASKPAVTAAQILLSNIVANPGGTACFTYQQPTVDADTYVTDVAITLTVQTQQVDPITKQFQTETKALLNVSPRNVFNVWELASQGSSIRVQPMPPSITASAAMRRPCRCPGLRDDERGHRAGAQPAPRDDDVGAGGLADVPVADRDVRQPELPPDVAGAVRRRIGRAQDGELPAQRLRAARPTAAIG